MAWKRIIKMMRFLISITFIFFFSSFGYSSNHETYKKLTMTKAKKIVLMAREPLIKARKLKPKDRETELWAEGV